MLTWSLALVSNASLAADEWTQHEMCVPVERKARSWAERPMPSEASSEIGSREPGGFDDWQALRESLERGVPPKAAVDVAALFRYLPWNDPPPAEGAPLAVRLTAAPHPVDPDKSLVRVGARASGTRGIDRPPVDLVVVLDVSLSMSSGVANAYPALHDVQVDFARARWPWYRYRPTSRLDLARAALRELVYALGPHDRLAIVTFGNGADVFLQPSAGDPDLPLLQRIDAISLPRRSDGDDGLPVATEAMDGMARPCGDWRFLVLSDGGASLDQPKQRLYAEVARSAASGRSWSGVTLAPGPGTPDDLEGLTWVGYGVHGYADTPYEAQRVFEAMLRRDGIVGREAVVEVDFGGAAARRLDGGGDIAPTLTTGTHYAALYEVDAPPRALSASVRWSVASPAPGDWAIDDALALEPVHVPTSFDGADPDLRLAWGVYEYARQIDRPDADWEGIFRVVEGARRAEHPVDVELLALIARTAAVHTHR